MERFRGIQLHVKSHWSTLYTHTQVRKNPDSWIYTVEKKEGKVGQALQAVNNLADTGKKFKLI